MGALSFTEKLLTLNYTDLRNRKQSGTSSLDVLFPNSMISRSMIMPNINFRSTIQFLDIGKSFLKNLQYIEEKVYLEKAHSKLFFPGLALHFAWHWDSTDWNLPATTN